MICGIVQDEGYFADAVGGCRQHHRLDHVSVLIECDQGHRGARGTPDERAGLGGERFDAAPSADPRPAGTFAALPALLNPAAAFRPVTAV